ncbi:peptidase M24 [Coprinopsis cinerea AmutBmut pab1-1]|nr:peptidase M24 [Coprinopsis cinerea AmutBmut pab1-1]
MQATNNALLRQLRAQSRRSLATVAKPAQHGQPFVASHPHLISEKDVTPGISAAEYDARRKKLMDMLPEASVVISVATPVKYMSNNIFYKYRQASDFWYLTGFEEPDSALIMEKTSTSKGYRMTLFSAGKDLAKEKWDGARTSFQDLEKIFGAHDAAPISSFSSRLRSILGSYSNVYVDVPNSTRRSTTNSILKTLTASLRGTTSLNDIPVSKRLPLAPEVAKLRHIKSDAERKIMHEAATISARAHAKTMRFAEPGKCESHLAAHFEYMCALNGSQRPAYVPVVASGPNALIIHYTSNNQIIGENELVLIDAGCEYNGYASDITRTFPASGSFTEPQKDIYTAVLNVQRKLVSYCFEEANVSMQELHRLSAQMLKEELNQIGFQLHGTSASDLERVLYPHYLSHPIGIDLHESTYFDRNAPLKEGNVITIEPGIYVPPTANFPKHYHNIGIRIEDEVLVGKRHPVVLSSNAPKEIKDIEGACQGKLDFQPL